MNGIDLSLKLMSEVDLYNKWIFKNIEPYLGENNLEIGCGIGNISQHLIKVGNLAAIDISQKYIQEVREKFKNHRNFQAFLWDLSSPIPDFLKKDSFDSIVFSNVLEHVENDLVALSNMNQLLKKGGYLNLLVPACPLAYGSLDKEMGHFRRYQKKELEEKLKKTSFEIL